jgi:TonB family protein
MAGYYSGARFAGSVISSAVFCIALGIPGFGSVQASGFSAPKSVTSSQPERRLSIAASHRAEVMPSEWPLALPKCGDVRQPEALLTPDPPLYLDDNPKARVSFIIGPDGQVHSAFVLESGNHADDETILRTVRLWRFRPAMCNGVPTDSEAVIRFSLQ